MCGCLSHTPLTGDLVYNPGMCPDWELNWGPFGSQPVLNPLSYTNQGIYPSNILFFVTLGSWHFFIFVNWGFQLIKCSFVDFVLKYSTESLLIIISLDKKTLSLARWLGLECCPLQQKVAGSIPGQGPYRRQTIDVPPTPILSLKINEHILGWGLNKIQLFRYFYCR